jgi:intergrase/recombinase
MDGWMDRWTDGRTDGRTNRHYQNNITRPISSAGKKQTTKIKEVKYLVVLTFYLQMMTTIVASIRL